MSEPTSYRVVCPVKRASKTANVQVGRAYRCADGVFDVYLDALPVNSRLKLIPVGQEDKS